MMQFLAIYQSCAFIW